jgi:hypothetical protein
MQAMASPTLPSFDVAERRARLARRHRLAGGEPADDAVQATRSVIALHATDPSSVYLSAWARVGDLSVADLEQALYSERSLIKHLAMRRTLFVVPPDMLPSVQAGASARVAASEQRRLIRDVERSGLQRDGRRWLRNACKQVLAALADGREATATQLREELPVLEGSMAYGEGKSWGGRVPVGPRVLTVLSAEGRIVRASNAGDWTTSRPRWAQMSAWLGDEIPPRAEPDGVRDLVECWLRAFGPGTVADIRWWLGSTIKAVRGALTELGAVEVALGTQSGYVLPDDIEPTEPVEPWAALLPALDPTAMGWFERDWYLGPHRGQVFDRTGNAGPTAWWDGQVVGGWRQNDGGEVEFQPLEDVGAEATSRLTEAAAELTTWLDGTRVSARFPSPLSTRA